MVAVDRDFLASGETSKMSAMQVRSRKRRSEDKLNTIKSLIGTGVRQSRRLQVSPQRGASSGLARDINRDMILELLRREQPIARVDLARKSGLQRSTVSLIVEELQRERWVKEGASVKTARGRHPTLISLNDEVVILVTDIHPTHAILAVMDLSGHFLTRDVVAMGTDAETAVKALVAQMRAMRTAFPTHIFEGIGVSLPGRVDPQTQRMIMAPNLCWGEYDLKSRLERELQLHVEMDNAANACLLSEQWFGHLPGVRNAVLVTVSEGIGTSILANGQIVLGQDGLAGEFGHVPIDPVGPVCACGSHGCWELFASSRATLRFHAESVRKQKAHVPATSIPELALRAANHEPKAIAALKRQAEYIAVGLRMITAALSPEIILFAGDIRASWTISAPIIEAELRKRLLAGAMPKISAIGDGELARLRGASALIMQRHAGYHRSPHLIGTSLSDRARSLDLAQPPEPG